MKKKGFTIIEVALVLAIAGLIFMMVFITLPQVWRTQRDTQRRDDMLTFVQRLKNFQTNNNRGALPSGNNSISYSFSRDEAKATSASDKVSWKAFYRDFFLMTFSRTQLASHIESSSQNVPLVLQDLICLAM